MSQFASNPTHKTVYTREAEAVEVPIDTVTDWRYAVANDDTTLGLLDFHQNRIDEADEEAESTLRARLLTILAQLPDRRQPRTITGLVLIRSEILQRLSPDEHEELVSIGEEIMSHTHSNGEVADAILEYLDR